MNATADQVLIVLQPVAALRVEGEVVAGQRQHQRLHQAESGEREVRIGRVTRLDRLELAEQFAPAADGRLQVGLPQGENVEAGQRRLLQRMQRRLEQEIAGFVENRPSTLLLTEVEPAAGDVQQGLPDR